MISTRPELLQSIKRVAIHWLCVLCIIVDWTSFLIMLIMTSSSMAHCLMMFPKTKDPEKQGRIPRSGVQAFKKFLLGFFWAFLLLQSDKFVTMEYMFSPEFVQYHGLFYRIIYMWILGFTFRLKYYTIWTIAEGACILCGIGYNGVDPETGEFKWNRVQNIDPWSFETGQNVRLFGGLESKHEHMVEKLRIFASCKTWQETRIQEYNFHIYYKCILARY